MRWIAPGRLKTDPDLASLFPIGDAELSAIVESMRERGYDPAEPLVIWEPESIVVDGHTRLKAAHETRLDKVAVEDRSFEDKRAALEYAIRRQRDRRNLSTEQINAFHVRAIEALDRVKPRGGDHKSPESKASIEAFDSGKSAMETAAQVGVSRAQVERVRGVLASDDEALKDQLRNGEVSINAAVTAVRERKTARVDPPLVMSVPTTFSVAEWEQWTASASQEQDIALNTELRDGGSAVSNQTNENINSARQSCNPVTCCLHNSPYGYARDIAQRSYAQGFVPTFIPSRLTAPTNTKRPARAATEVGWRNVFVCSMADLFGKWVPAAWIKAVLNEVELNEQWNFLFLTKFPQRLAEIPWPANAWCGTSVDQQYRVAIAEKSFRDVQAGVKWLSCEPLMERLTFTSLEMFDWVVIGAASASTQTPEFQPPWEWVEHLIRQGRAAGCRIYIKPNLKSRPQEYPTGIVE